MSEKKTKILLIEDDEVLMEMYKSKFTSEGYEFIFALDGHSGLELVQKERPDLILLDIILPRMDGFEVLKKLKEDTQLKDIPVILLTNLGQKEDQDRGLKFGAVSYLVKANHTPAQVVEKVKLLLKS